MMEEFDTTGNKDKDSAELQKLIEQANYTKAPTVFFLNTEIDVTSMIIIIVSLVLWTILWFSFGLFKINKYGIIVFLAYFVYCIHQVFSSDIMVADTAKSEEFLYEKENFIQNGLNICMFLLVFLYAIKIDGKIKKNIYLVQTIAIILMIIPCALINTRNIGYNFRLLRKVKGSFYNKGLFLFLYAVILLLLQFK